MEYLRVKVRIFRIWFCIKMIKLCSYCLSFQDGAECQSDINEVSKTKNYFINELEKLQAKKI